ATPRHQRIVTESVEKDTGIPVVGIIPRMQDDIFPMRHLGVTPHQEYGTVETNTAVNRLAGIAEEHFNLQRIRSLMELRPFNTSSPSETQVSKKKHTAKLTIGILRDAAFQFYYQENLEALCQGGAELVMINALSAERLPKGLDALYIGGGFPETSARQLAQNTSFRDSVRHAAEQGLPIYAECGGLIFLGRSILLENVEYPLAGVFPVTFSMSAKPQAHGYSIFTVEQKNPFYRLGTEVKGHEFRYSVVESWDGISGDLAVNMERGTGFQDKRDGLQKYNVLALYTHVLASGTPEWAAGLLQAARVHRSQAHS
ncbi:MAG: cobyrinic acid a,c-diamide synthase, partial [Candidatus Electrothrix sp. AR3]|nr:cobyrinic acid a,c-diamide synthase [Candidatus Electrothrix sp. AR3]